MNSRIVIDGNAFYEIDEECMKKMEAKKEEGNRKSVGAGKRQMTDSEHKKVRTS